MGRPRKDSAGRESVQLGMRISPRLRDQLDQARQRREPALTLTQEVEMRLEASFGDIGALQNLFGSPVNYWLFTKIADQIANAERVTGQKWWRDRYTFKQVEVMIRNLVGFFEPAGDGTPPQKKTKGGAVPLMVAGGLGAALAGRALMEVHGSLVGKRMEAALEKNPTLELSRPTAPPRTFTKKERTAFLDDLNDRGA